MIESLRDRGFPGLDVLEIEAEIAARDRQETELLADGCFAGAAFLAFDIGPRRETGNGVGVGDKFAAMSDEGGLSNAAPPLASYQLTALKISELSELVELAVASVKDIRVD